MARFLLIFSMLATATLIAGCSGGGDGDGAPPPSATLTSVTPTNGSMGVALDAKIEIKLDVRNISEIDASKMALSCNSLSKGFTTTTSVTSLVGLAVLVPNSPIGYGETCVLSGDILSSGLWGSTKTTVSVTFTALPVPVCTPPEEWNGSICAEPALNYVDKVYVQLFVGPSAPILRSISRSEWTDLKIASTRAIAGACKFSAYALSDGKVPLLCETWDEKLGQGFAVFYINPVRDEISDFTGNLPANLQYAVVPDPVYAGLRLKLSLPEGTAWMFGSLPNPARPQWALSTKVTNGWYFVTPGGMSLGFEDNSGKISSGPSMGSCFSVGNCGIDTLMSYSN